ncbi:NapC/NirT family cytochrome c [Ferrimonas balearica]|uniref:NapC/NirT family cytochrome c n=1 Tax=Ferrimonas balearica TaxID=44012 RepID=UPI0021BD1B7E|nr:NapC/NirT family cytochrome c [Ferrimonas balearica]
MMRDDQGFWARLWRSPKARWRLGIPLGGLLFFVLGAVGTVGFNVVIHETSSDTFCVSCHGPSKFAAEEWPQHTHYNTASGVLVTCADCHVANEFVPKMWRKIRAMKEVYYQTLGTYDTREKFEAHRQEMAESVWAEMRETDSRECRSCHKVELMDFARQKKAAASMHQRMEKMGKTCIDCHKFLAHDRPAKPQQGE